MINQYTLQKQVQCKVIIFNILTRSFYLYIWERKVKVGWCISARVDHHSEKIYQYQNILGMLYCSLCIVMGLLDPTTYFSPNNYIHMTHTVIWPRLSYMMNLHLHSPEIISPLCLYMCFYRQLNLSDSWIKYQLITWLRYQQICNHRCTNYAKMFCTTIAATSWGFNHTR